MEAFREPLIPSNCAALPVPGLDDSDDELSQGISLPVPGLDDSDDELIPATPIESNNRVIPATLIGSTAATPIESKTDRKHRNKWFVQIIGMTVLLVAVVVLGAELCPAGRTTKQGPMMRQSVTFVGDYDVVVGKHKDSFLRQCTASLSNGVVCDNVWPGSIVIDLSGEEAALQAAINVTKTNGLDLSNHSMAYESAGDPKAMPTPMPTAVPTLPTPMPTPMPTPAPTIRCFDGQVKELDRAATRVDCQYSTLVGEVKDLPRAATSIILDHSALTGDVKDLPRDATVVQLDADSLEGNVKDLPLGAIRVDLRQSWLEGNVADLPRSAKTLQLEYSALVGDVKDLPRKATYLQLYESVLVGDVKNLPCDASFLEFQNSRLTGNIADLPRGAIHINMGHGILEGQVSDMPQGSETCFLASSTLSCGALKDYGLCKKGCTVW